MEYKYYILMTTIKGNYPYFYFMRIKVEQDPLSPAKDIIQTWDKPFRRAYLFCRIEPSARLMQINALPIEAVHLMNDIPIYSTAIPSELVWPGLTRKEMYDKVETWYYHYHYENDADEEYFINCPNNSWAPDEDPLL